MSAHPSNSVQVAAPPLPSVATRRVALVPLFASTLFTSAALLFTIEPMFGKMVLPLLGGAPAVWNTCMVFYQAALLAGYAYAHVLTGRFRLRTQVSIHLVLLAAAAFALPVSIAERGFPAADHSPTAWLLGTMFVLVGGPLFVLSATAPLLQKWFSNTDDVSARDPYFLYAASNVGSILALLAYPLVIEPAISLSNQSRGWSAGYLVLAALTLGCGIAAGRSSPTERARSNAATQGVERITPWRRMRWLALSFLPSSLMLSVTTYLSTDVAAVPLLWTVPLALYLLSFVFAFSPRAAFSTRLIRNALMVVTLPIVAVLLLRTNRPVWLIVPLHLVVLFTYALALHRALADDRPSPARLTEFYLWLAVGGAIGGLFNTLVAPHLFASVAEYPLVLAAGCVLALWPAGLARVPRFGWAFPILTAASATLLVLGTRPSSIVPESWVAPLGIAGLFFYVMCGSNPRWVAAAVVLALAAGPLAREQADGLLYAKRTFFGIYRVVDVPAQRQHRLEHGTTLHGGQLTDVFAAKQATFYYHPFGPIGQVIQAAGSRLRNADIGVVGLGAGTLAAYAEDGQRWTFYEIDPDMERIARDRRLFTYLGDCGAMCTVVIGDARLSLSSPTAPRHTLLILDAFSSDAIPVHLMTREAFDVYMSKLTEDGILAVHVSNRHLDLKPILATIAAERRLEAFGQHFKASEDPAQSSSEWVVLAKSAATLEALATDPRWARLEPRPGFRVWTDDFSNILSVLKPLW